MHMEKETKILQIANVYYNRGLEKAGYRDLTGAVEDLKICLRLNKYQTDARNLLGLIYNEIGEVGDALIQWVISTNLQEEDNQADHYLREIRKSRGYIEIADQAARKYNQALHYAQNDNEDLASLMLMRMLEEFPQYVKAQQLLALLYLHREDYTKAGRCLYQAQKIDPFDPLTLRYMDIAKRNTGRAEVEKRKMKNAFSHRQMQDDDVIMPSSYKENTGLQSVLNIIAGLVMGTAAVYFLIVPGIRESLNSRHNQEMKLQLETINQQNIRLADLDEQMISAKAAKEQAEQSLAQLTESSEYLRTQFKNLIQIIAYLETEQITKASALYVNTDWELLSQEENLADAIANVQGVMKDTGYKNIAALGDRALDEERDPAKAIDYYLKSLAVRGDSLSVRYKLGVAYSRAGDTETANQYFGDLITNYPDSEFAAMAKAQRGY